MYNVYNLYAGCRSHAHARAETISDARADGPIRAYTHVHTQIHVTQTHTDAYTHRHTNTDASPHRHCHHRPVRDYPFLVSVLFISFLLSRPSFFPHTFRTTGDHAFSGHRPRQVAHTSANNAQATAPDFFNMSSWQDYVDKHLLASRCVTKAAIAGHDGNVWAKSDGFDVSKEELSKIALGFENQDTLTSSGITLASVRYIYLSGTDKVIRAKQGKVGAHCVKTQQTIVVSLYEDPVQPQQAALVVEKLGDHLVAHGY